MGVIGIELNRGDGYSGGGDSGGCSDDGSRNGGG